MLADEGIMVMVVFKRKVFYRALMQSRLCKMREERMVETGDGYPGVYVLEKIAAAQPAIE